MHGRAQAPVIDTPIDPAGVCCDFAHLMFAWCRTLNVPARGASGRDAAEVACARISGPVSAAVTLIGIRAVPGVEGRLNRPDHCAQALSTNSAQA